MSIQRTVNVCFPRSGHRFLRNLCQAYFGRDFKFRENHQGLGYSFGEANYIKDHDLALLRGGAGIPILPENRYLIQFRHPLESLVSYYEFQVRHGRLGDSKDEWEHFLMERLTYWTYFAQKWCLPNVLGSPFLRVRYSDLCSDSHATLTRVILFLTDDGTVDVGRVDKVVRGLESSFARYVDEEKARDQWVTQRRDVREFKFFDESFAAVEERLKKDYLDLLGLGALFLH